MPQVTHFKPAGIPASTLESVGLTVEETEAIRLKDLEGLQQEECAQRTRISRLTFHRVLESARQKVADALINGFEEMASGLPLACPRCDSPSVLPVWPASPGLGGRRGWGQGRGRGHWQGGGR